ncbi:MAG: hypothetical protein GY906_33170 [bacterium]|nr:hypothetical protein [bacterium]
MTMTRANAGACHEPSFEARGIGQKSAPHRHRVTGVSFSMAKAMTVANTHPRLSSEANGM